MNKDPLPAWLIPLGFFIFLIDPRLFLLLLFGYLLFYFLRAFLRKSRSPFVDFLNREFSHLFSQDKKDEAITLNKKTSDFSFSLPPMPSFSLGKTLGLFLLFFVAVLFLLDGLVSVPAGHVAVIYDRGKGVLEKEMNPGLHLKIPFWQQATIMNTRLQAYTMSVTVHEGKQKGDDSIEALTKDGQQVKIDVTVQYRIDEKYASDIYQSVGLDYESIVVRPSVRSVIRQVITGYNSEQLFLDKSRIDASQKMEEILRKKFEEQHILLDSVLVRNVLFSQTYLNAIEQKKVQVQINEKTELEKIAAENRKEIKIIEATAEAESIKLKGESLRQSPEVIQLQFVEKMAPQINWGILPDGALPLLDISKMQK